MVVLPDAVAPSSKVLLRDVNECITCHICKGYIIDATTIVECCHSFCHSCIVPHLRTKEYCPKCELIINKTKPNIKPDATFQAIVYKLVPGLYEKELQRRRGFYSSRPEEAKLATPEQRGEDIEHLIFRPTEKISLSLEYAFIDEHKNRSLELTKPKYLQCPAIFPVSLLGKFVMMKFGIDSAQFNVDIMYKVKTIVLPEYYTLMDVAYIYTWKREAPMRFFFRVRTKETKSEELPEVPLRRSPSINSRQAQVATDDATPEVKEESAKDTPKPSAPAKKDISDKCIKVEKSAVKVGKSGKKNYEECVKSEKSEKRDKEGVKVKKEKVSQESGKKCENIKLKIGLSKDNSKMMVIKDISPNPSEKKSKATETPSKSPKERVPQVVVKIEKCAEPKTVVIPTQKEMQKSVKQEPKSPTEVSNHTPTANSTPRTPVKLEAREKTPSPTSSPAPSTAKEVDVEQQMDLEEITKSQFLNSFELTAKKVDVSKSQTNPKTDSASKRKSKEPVKKNRLPELPNLLADNPNVSVDVEEKKKPPVTNGFVVPKAEPPSKRPKKDEVTVPRRKYTNFVKIAPKQSSSTVSSLMNSAAFIGGSGTSKLSMRSSSTPSRIAPPRRQSVATDNPSRILQDTFSMLQKNSTEIKKIDAAKEGKVYGPQMRPPPTPGLPMPRTPNHVPEYWNFSMRNGSPKTYMSPYSLSSPLYTPNYSPNSPQYAPTYNIPITQSQFKYTGLPTNSTAGLPRALGKGAEEKKEKREDREHKRAKSASPTAEAGEPPEKQRKVQSLLNSCNITFPSSLSITLTNEQNDAEANKSSKTTKLKKPVNNYIEILKLPSDGATTVTPIPPAEDTRNGKVSPKEKPKDLLTKVSELATKATETSKKGDKETEATKKQLPKLNPIDKASPSLPTSEGGAESFQQTYLMSLLNQSDYKNKMQNKLYDLKTNKIIPLDGVTSTSPESRPSPPPPPKSKSEPSSLVKESQKEEVKPSRSASALDLSSVTSSADAPEAKDKKSKEARKSPQVALMPLSHIPPSPDLLMAGLTPAFPGPLNYPAFWMEQYQRMKKAGSEALELYFQNMQKSVGKSKGASESKTPPPSTPTTISSTVKDADK